MRTLLTQPLYEKISSLIKHTENARFDLVSPICMMLLGIMSVFYIYSAQSYYSEAGHQWMMQILWLSLGFIVYGLMSMINYKIYLEHAHIIYAISILMLLLIWSPLGLKVYGAQRWLNFRVFSVQASDPAKIGTLIFGAAILARSQITNFKSSLNALGKTIGAFFLPIVLIFLQPDLGSCLVFPPMLFALLYVSKLSKRFFVTTFGLFVLLMGIVAWDISGYAKFIQNNPESKPSESYEEQGILPLKDYQRKRILTFVAPHIIDPKGIGDNWNLRQSLISIGTGGLFGKGHNNGTQAKLGYLPASVAPNDFIFSVLAEERGFMGGLFVILLFAILIGNGIKIATIARDRFGVFLAIGVSTIFMVHVFINIGMTIGIMPITGIPLPFLSYGGSFILSCCILQGLIQSIYRFRRNA